MSASNVVNFRAPGFVNIHGKPVGVSMKNMVLSGAPEAWCHHRTLVDKSSNEPRDWYTIKVPEYQGEPPDLQGFVGTGATEEAAWRDAYFQLVGGEKP